MNKLLIFAVGLCLGLGVAGVVHRGADPSVQPPDPLGPLGPPPTITRGWYWREGMRSTWIPAETPLTGAQAKPAASVQAPPKVAKAPPQGKPSLRAAASVADALPGLPGLPDLIPSLRASVDVTDAEQEKLDAALDLLLDHELSQWEYQEEIEKTLGPARGKTYIDHAVAVGQELATKMHGEKIP